MSHPPIPQNCPYFRVLSGRIVFGDIVLLWPLGEFLSEFQKHTIACVAAEYWMMEESRLLQSCDDEAPAEVWIAIGKAVNEAGGNADAWRKWGGLQ